jgi:hypothetical protein
MQPFSAKIIEKTFANAFDTRARFTLKETGNILASGHSLSKSHCERSCIQPVADLFRLRLARRRHAGRLLACESL